MTTCPVASMVSAPRNRCLMASAVPTARMSAPSTATAPLAITRPPPSIVTTVPPVTTSDTCRSCVCVQTAAIAIAITPTSAAIHFFMLAILQAPSHLRPLAPLE